MRVRFTEVFQLEKDGSISPKVPVLMNGVNMSPGVACPRGASFGEVDVYFIKGRDLDVEKDDGVLKIKGSYEIT